MKQVAGLEHAILSPCVLDSGAELGPPLAVCEDDPKITPTT